jgi:hypothetical protein
MINTIVRAVGAGAASRYGSGSEQSYRGDWTPTEATILKKICCTKLVQEAKS